MSERDKLLDEMTTAVMDMPGEDLLEVERITQVVILKLDTIDRLTDKEENLVQVAVMATYREFKKGKK